MVDRSGPEIIFNGLIPDEWQKGNRFTVSATDAISGPKQIAYWFSYDNTKQYIDVAAIHSEINGEGKVVHYTDNSVGIPDGEFDIFAQAADRMDNLGDVASIHVKIDTADPILQFAPDANEQNTAFAIELIASDKLSDNAVTDNASGVDRIVYSIRNNTAEIQEEYNEPIKIEAEGQYYLEATAIDHAGNQSVIEKKTYIMDTTSPVIVEVIVTRAKPAVVEIVAHDKTELEYSFDAGITWQKERMKNYMQNTILPAEAIQVRDAAGNITKWPQAVRVVLPSSGGGGGESIWPPEDNENEKQLAKEVERELAGGKDRDGQPLYLKTGLSADRGQLAKGYLAGYEDNTFRPERAITRGEAAALLGRVLDIEQNVSAPKTYLDIDDHWATADIALVQSRDLIPDQGEYFEPDRDITIGEMSRVLDNILDLEAYDSDSAKTSTGSIEVQATQRAYNAGLLPVKDEAVIDTRAKMSRVETVIVFNRVFGLNDQDIRRPAFKDITMQDWYYGDVGKATLKVCTKCEQAN